VVAFNAIAPRAGIRGGPKDTEVVFAGIATFSIVLFHNAEDIFQAHDGLGFDDPLLAEAGAEESRGKVLLCHCHFS
jgi:hypothetical protein